MTSNKDLGMVEIHSETETGHGQGEEISTEVILDKGTETGVTQETGHGPEEETEGIEVMIDNRGRDRSRDYYGDSRDYRDRAYGDSRSNRGDRSRGNNRKGIMVTIIEGLTIVLDAIVIKVAIRDLRIEVILMAEETQEEMLNVLMKVYSPCRTP